MNLLNAHDFILNITDRTKLSITVEAHGCDNEISEIMDEAARSGHSFSRKDIRHAINEIIN